MRCDNCGHHIEWGNGKTKRNIINLLHENYGELFITEIKSATSLAWPTVYRHITDLKERGVVTTIKRYAFGRKQLLVQLV